jgi:hypothetical protein
MKYKLVIVGRDPQELIKLLLDLDNLDRRSKEENHNEAIIAPEENQIRETPLAKYEHKLEDAAKCNCKNCGEEFIPARKSMIYCSKKCYMHVYLDKKRNGTKEVKADRSCKECGTLFSPVQKNSIFCSKKCYMVDWYKRKLMRNISVENVDAFPFDTKHDDIDLKAKLKEIKETCPAPMERPDFQRDFNG